MKRLTGLLSVFALLLFAVEAQAQAQVSAPPTNVFFTVEGGGFFPASDIGQGEFENTEAVSATLGTWLSDFVGVRANGVWANPSLSGDPPTQLVGEDPDLFYYTGDVLLRYPMQVAEGTVIPYAVGGLGARTMRFDAAENQTDLAGTAGAGLEYRFGMMQNWGVRTELRALGSNFDAFGVDDTLWDVAWTGGLTFAF